MPWHMVYICVYIYIYITHICREREIIDVYTQVCPMRNV